MEYHIRLHPSGNKTKNYEKTHCCHVTDDVSFSSSTKQTN